MSLKPSFVAIWAILSLVAALLSPHRADAQELISHGRFQDVTLYHPAGIAKGFVLFLSGDAGWDEEVEAMARALTAEGVMVAGIDTPKLFEALRADGGDCEMPDGDLENLAHYVQGYAKLPTYFTPVLVGYSSGATLAYAMIAQAPPNVFAGAISLGFCVDLELGKPLCRGENVHFKKRPRSKSIDLLPAPKLDLPWFDVQGAKDRVCHARAAKLFANKVGGATYVELSGATHDLTVAAWRSQLVAAYRAIAASRPSEALPAPPATLGDLAIVEVPAISPAADSAAEAGTAGTAGTAASSMFAILVSGDGGWAGLDRSVASALSARGIPVAGLDSLRYFWTARTPQGFASDIDRMIRFYATRWNKSHALLIGYSQGADVLPFAVNRLPAGTRALVARTVLMGPGQNASFEFHLSNWLGTDEGLPILPEAQKLGSGSVLCLYGDDERDSLCAKLPPGRMHSQMLPGGHHFNGAYDELADLILASAPR
jgi:type IV secretory pathway VirJ component